MHFRKSVVVIGVFLVTSVFILALVVYYLSQGVFFGTLGDKWKHYRHDYPSAVPDECFCNQAPCGPGTFPCANMSVCIPQRSMCNGYNDCPKGEDEDIITCGISGFPQNCSCRNVTWLSCKNLGLSQVPQTVTRNVTRMILMYNTIKLTEKSFEIFNLELIHLEGNGIGYLPTRVFGKQHKLRRLLLGNNLLSTLPDGVLNGLGNLEWLFLKNNQLETLHLESGFKDLTNLSWLILSDNNLTMRGEIFPELLKLNEIYLDNNKIEYIEEETFSNLKGLACLNLQNNLIAYVHENAFKKNSALKDLDLSHNLLKILPPIVFFSQMKLTKLSLAYNPFKQLPRQLFWKLKNLASLNLQDIEIVNIDVGMFNFLTKLDFVYFKKFLYCTYAPLVPKCKPTTDGVSSFEHLLVKPVLRVTVWIVAAMIGVGNSLVLWGRFSSKDENRVLSLVIRNLAVSDMLMSVYLVVIGFQDAQLRGVYNQQAHIWMSSWTCTCIGVIAMISSEVSVFILVFMSMERFLLIAIPFGTHQTMTSKTAVSWLFFIWFVGFSLAAVPVLYWRDTTRFYGTNGMCFPLHIDDPFFFGWEYSAFIFLGLNMTSLALIAVLYIGMFASICYTRKNTPITNLGDMEFAVRFFFIVLTDAGCWAPIIVLKLLAIERFDISPDLYAWVVVFILPVNSAVNPLLYTFTTSKYRNQLAALSWSFWSKRTTFGRRKSSADTETSRSSSHRNIVSYTKGKRLSQDLPCTAPILNPIKSALNTNWGISTARSGSEDSETIPESCEEKITDIVPLQSL